MTCAWKGCDTAAVFNISRDDGLQRKLCVVHVWTAVHWWLDHGQRYVMVGKLGGDMPPAGEGVPARQQPTEVRPA